MADQAGLIEPGNINLFNRPKVRNPDGSTSTVRSMSVNFDGREVLIPTVSDDGRVMSDDEAINAYLKTGQHLGIFDTPKNATAYADRLHNEQASHYGLSRDQRPVYGDDEVAPHDARMGLMPALIGVLGDYLNSFGGAVKEVGGSPLAGQPVPPSEMSPEQFAHMLETAGVGLSPAVMGGVSRAMMGRAPPGEVEFGVFGGRRAATADQAALARAEEMAAQGAQREQIWQDTGWFQGVDGKWRFEIDDSAMAMNKIGETLPESVHHPEMFSAYPAMSAIETRQGASMGKAHYSMGDAPSGLPPEIVMGPRANRSTMAHELQHGVADQEGFARGGNVAMAFGADRNGGAWPIYRERIQKMRTPLTLDEWAKSQFDGDIEAARSSHNDYLRTAGKITPELDRLAQQSAAEEYYRRLAGETEARTVQKRLDMTPEQRRARPPWLDYDVPEAQQIVRYGSGEQASMPPSRPMQLRSPPEPTIHADVPDQFALPLDAPTQPAPAPFVRPRTFREAMEMGIKEPDRDPAKYPIKAPEKSASLDEVKARFDTAEGVAAQLRAMGYKPRVEAKGAGNSVYLSVPLKDPNNPTAPGDFKARFSDHGTNKWTSVSVDPASGNTPDDVLRAFRHHVGIDETPPEIGWSQIEGRETGGGRQRGGIGVYERDFRERGRTHPIRKTIRLFADGAPAPVVGEVTTEDIVARLRALQEAQK